MIKLLLLAMTESKPNVTKERAPYEWLRYIRRVDLSQVRDIQSLRFAIEELPECIAYHENWLSTVVSISTDLDWVERMIMETHELRRALASSLESLAAVMKEDANV